MTEGQPFPPPDQPPEPPPPPPPPGAPPGSGEDSPGPQPPERRLIPAQTRRESPLLGALRGAATLALDALDYAGDRVAEKISGARRTDAGHRG